MRVDLTVNLSDKTRPSLECLFGGYSVQQALVMHLTRIARARQKRKQPRRHKQSLLSCDTPVLPPEFSRPHAKRLCLRQSTDRINEANRKFSTTDAQLATAGQLTKLRYCRLHRSDNGIRLQILAHHPAKIRPERFINDALYPDRLPIQHRSDGNFQVAHKVPQMVCIFAAAEDG